MLIFSLLQMDPEIAIFSHIIIQDFIYLPAYMTVSYQHSYNQALVKAAVVALLMMSIYLTIPLFIHPVLMKRSTIQTSIDR